LERTRVTQFKLLHSWVSYWHYPRAFRKAWQGQLLQLKFFTNIPLVIYCRKKFNKLAL